MAAKPTRRMWVHRLSTDEGGSPVANVSLGAGIDPVRVLQELLRPPVRLERDEEGGRRFLLEELRQGRLRQGWGFPGLDVRKATFQDEYVIAMRRYWGAIREEDVSGLRALVGHDARAAFEALQGWYRIAEGRKRILTRMIQMNRGDVVFLPNVPKEGESFSVARIADTGYRFEDRRPASPTRFWEMDFGHRRDVSDLREFAYSAETLPADVFGAPYRHAIDPVSAKQALFEDFCLRQFT